MTESIKTDTDHLGRSQNEISQAKTKAKYEFDVNYVTSTEMMKRLNVNRTTILYYRRTGILPGSFNVPGTRGFIWYRKFIEPYITNQAQVLIEKGHIK